MPVVLANLKRVSAEGIQGSFLPQHSFEDWVIEEEAASSGLVPGRTGSQATGVKWESLASPGFQSSERAISMQTAASLKVSGCS